MSASWPPLESNPETIAKYAAKIGVPDEVGFEDVYSVESWALGLITRPVIALLFVYPIKPQHDHKGKGASEESEEPEIEGVWFTKQTQTNACGTVALLHIFSNLGPRFAPKAGGFLANFYSSTHKLSKHDRAKALESNEELQAAHIAAGEEGQSDLPENNETNDHFVALIPYKGKLLTMDGRRSGPVAHGETTEASFFKDAVRVVKECYIDRDPEELRFSIIAVTAAS